MSGEKHGTFSAADLESVNFEPELGEIHFVLKDGRIFRKYLKPSDMEKVIEILQTIGMDSNSANKLFDLIDSLENTSER